MKLQGDSDFIKAQGGLLVAVLASLPSVDVLLKWGQLVLVIVSVCYAVHKWARSIRQENRDEKDWEEKHEKRKIKWPKRFFILVLALAFIPVGCTHYSNQIEKLDPKTQERVKELVQGAGLANAKTDAGLLVVSNWVATLHSMVLNSNLIPASLTSNLVAETFQTRRAVDVTSDQIRRAANVVGPPINDQSALIQNLLSENASLRAQAEKQSDVRRSEEATWRSEKAVLEAKLQEYGKKYEEERNRSIVKRVWFWATGLFGIAGAVAFFVFCPAIALPLLGRLLGWIVAAAPAVAGWVGVVGKKAFDQVIVGVQKGKDALRASGKPAEAEVINTELHKAVDEQHRDLVDIRKDALRDAIAPS